MYKKSLFIRGYTDQKRKVLLNMYLEIERVVLTVITILTGLLAIFFLLLPRLAKVSLWSASSLSSPSPQHFPPSLSRKDIAIWCCHSKTTTPPYSHGPPRYTSPLYVTIMLPSHSPNTPRCSKHLRFKRTAKAAGMPVSKSLFRKAGFTNGQLISSRLRD